MNNEDYQLLQSFKKFRVGHHQYQNALDIIHKSIETTALRGEPACTLLLGNSGMGKTSVCEHLRAEYGEPYKLKRDDKILIIRPIIYCRIPNPVTLKGLASTLISSFNTKSEPNILNFLDLRLAELFKNCETKVIILDELQHLLNKGADRSKEIMCDWFKVLSDYFGGEVILSGTPNCEEIINRHDALAGRFPYRAMLTPFNLSSQSTQREFFDLIVSFSNEIQTTMHFSTMQPLTDKDIFLSLYAISGGNMRSLRVILYSAITTAFTNNRDSLSIADFAIAAETVDIQTRLFEANPFKMTTRQLEKNLFG